MSKVGINYAIWNNVVHESKQATSSISITKVQNIKDTTLKRFTKFPALEKDIQKVVTSYKNANQMETTKMLAVGKKIVAEDSSAARQLNENTSKMKGAI